MSVFIEAIVSDLEQQHPDRCYAFLRAVDACAENMGLSAFDVQRIVDDYADAERKVFCFELLLEVE